MTKVFELDINFDDLTGIEFNSFVSSPAHSKLFMAFNKEVKEQLFFNDEKMEVTGVMVSADQLIPRWDKSMGRYEVYFSKNSVKNLMLKFHKQKFGDRVNINHDSRKVAENVFMIESYLVDKQKGIYPTFLGEHINDGSWVATYKVENYSLWNKIKSGELTGFSVEGLFQHIERKLLTKNQIQMSKEKHTLAKVREMFFGKSQAFAEVTTDTDLVLFYEGELAVGTAMSVEVDGERISAPEGSYALTGEMEGTVLVVDASGIVTEVITATVPAPANEPAPEDVTMAAVIEEIKDLKEMFYSMKKENEELKEKLNTFAKQPAVEPTKRIETREEKIARLIAESKK